MEKILDNNGIIELTMDQFLENDLSDIGFDGQNWEPWIKAVIVNGIVVFDRNHALSSKSRKLFNQWLKTRFNYQL